MTALRTDDLNQHMYGSFPESGYIAAFMGSALMPIRRSRGVVLFLNSGDDRTTLIFVLDLLYFALSSKDIHGTRFRPSQLFFSYQGCMRLTTGTGIL